MRKSGKKYLTYTTRKWYDSSSTLKGDERHSGKRLNQGHFLLWRSLETSQYSMSENPVKTERPSIMATEQQIPKLAGSLVEPQGGFSALSTEDSQ
jgi:hypothetical protein